ncbi:MAG TPA: hypothetical protein VN081_01580 [Dongiaceae bacterium]|nr:hypothetical protein [Dongiaceae bacterium]
MDINKKQKLVLQAIEMQPDAVNDDALLYATVWALEGWDSSRSLYDNLKHCTRGETIYRRRRELYQMGLISYDAEALQSRDEAFKHEVEAHSVTGAAHNEQTEQTEEFHAVSWLYD